MIGQLLSMGMNIASTVMQATGDKKQDQAQEDAKKPDQGAQIAKALLGVLGGAAQGGGTMA